MSATIFARRFWHQISGGREFRSVRTPFCHRAKNLPPTLSKMSLVDVATAADFDAHVAAADVVACHFWASWCEPCAAMDQLLATFAAQHAAARFLRVEAESVDELVGRFDVNAVPFFTFHEKGALADTLEGADAEALAEKLNARLGRSLGAAAAAPAVRRGGPGCEARALTTSAPVLLFMKGTKQEPRCGFSRRVARRSRTRAPTLRRLTFGR